MIINAKVIASFNEFGDICPLWIKISHCDKEYTYKVKESTKISRDNERSAYSISYRCIVEHEGNKSKRELTLNYNIMMHSWKTTVNNSIFLFNN